MRHVKLTAVGLATAVCAAACVAAAPAFAESGFSASIYKKTITPATPAQLKGVGNEEQTWTFGGASGYHIVCHKAGAAGKMEEPFTETVTLIVKFSTCHVIYITRFGEKEVKNEYRASFGKVNPETKVREGITLVYHNNGFVQAEPNESGEEVEFTSGRKVTLLPVSATWTLPARPEPDCIISLPEQTIPAKAIKEPNGTYSAAVYENTTRPVPVSKAFPTGEKEVVNFINEFKDLKFVFTGGKCAEETENRQGVRGTYGGSFVTEVRGGNFSFKE